MSCVINGHQRNNKQNLYPSFQTSKTKTKIVCQTRHTLNQQNIRSTLLSYTLLTNKRAMKNVRFATKCKRRRFIGVADDEKEKVWWAGRDLRRFRGHCVETICLMEHGKQNLLGDYCYRGLEHFSPEKLMERRKRIRHAISLVLHEQKCLKQKGKKETAILSQKYQDCCVQPRLEAHLRGLQDYQAQLFQTREDERGCVTQQQSPPATTHFNTKLYSGKRIVSPPRSEERKLKIART